MVKVVRSVEGVDLDQLWKVYQQSFAETDDFCAQEQLCYDETTLAEAMLDPDYWKFILLVDNKPVGFCLLTNNLRKARIAYCNDKFFQKKFPKYVSAGRLYYVTAICTLPKQGARGLGAILLKSVCEFIFENKALVAYDFSEAKNTGLTTLIRKVGERFAPVLEIVLDRQCYTSLYYDPHGQPS